MKKSIVPILIAALFVTTISACGANNQPSNSEPASSSQSSADQGPKKTVSNLSISLTTENSKAYIKVTGKQENYTADEFKWAWGLMNESGDFVDGKEKPQESDFAPATFSSGGSFTVKYCLTTITTMVSGEIYRIYGGTPETYGDIPFASNNFGASDSERKYYLRSDKDNSLTFDSIQPISFTKATIVEIKQDELPTGVTTPGAYVKFGGANSKNFTIADLDARHDAHKIAGNFQCTIGSYSVRNHSDEERFYKIEGNELFFYCYVGFIQPSEGWMVHFDMVGGNSNANLQLDSTIDGVSYTINQEVYKVYADKNKGNEENYWGCLGIYREA